MNAAAPAAGQASAMNRPLRVIAWPAFSNRVHNPYNHQLYSNLQRLGVEVTEFSPWRLLRRRHDIWHLHWPESLFSSTTVPGCVARALRLLTLQMLARMGGVRIVWTIHNLGSHERRYPRLEKWFWPRFLRRVDAFISLSQTAMVLAEAHYGLHNHTARRYIVPHGHYRDAYVCDTPRAQAREKLGVAKDEFLIVYFGLIRPYKGVPELVRAFRGAKQHRLRLIVAGAVKQEEEAAAIRAAGDGDPRLHLDFRFLSDAEMIERIRAANLVALPSRTALNSGSLLLALSCGTPTAVSRSPLATEMQREVGERWLTLIDDPWSPQTLDAAITWAREPRQETGPALVDLNWGELARRTMAAYTEVLRCGHGDCGRDRQNAATREPGTLE